MGQASVQSHPGTGKNTQKLKSIYSIISIYIWKFLLWRNEKNQEVREGKHYIFPKKKRNRMKGMGDNGEKLEESKVGTVSPFLLWYGEIWAHNL